jgi:hypothetical protein
MREAAGFLRLGLCATMGMPYRGTAMIKPGDIDPDNLRRVQELLTPLHDEIAETAALAGYLDLDIAHALLSLAVMRVLEADANADPDDAIRTAVLAIHKPR